ncbi:MAG: ankyrin repeat domain-containing protein [Hydrogenophaga sp.]|uniref:ankyrin repeat domain-containing protein n=1 Tax=Hydrogenophaga sp. TaxID=1904254 RepID=UPI002772A662|nr:ankyrin repeat domain-containing protein [Hydrogenophaga sp.]MDP2419550.1 ankyrin repeat domain-containing protein [Hydrogenophaga sp.]MDZ4173272.1 ankyrin repeat domain-containing protein [Hydrogenophaga sp.]
MDGGNWKEMFAAAEEGDLALVEYHVSRGVDVNYAHPEFLSTPLVASILARQENIVHFLLAAGADPALRSEFDGLTPVQAARRVGWPALEDKLVALGALPLPPVVAGNGWFGRLFSGLFRRSGS